VLASREMVRTSRWLLALAALLAAPAAGAQGTRFFLPPSAVLTNYDRVLIGQEEAIESGAFVARVADSTAGWYNPAGLALVKRSVIGASATGYELDIVDLGQIQASAGKTTLAQLPSYFGAVLGGDVIHSEAWRIGFSATKPTSWSTAVNGATLDGGSAVYSSRVSISTLVPALSAAWTPVPGLRLGGGLGVAITSISQTQQLSLRALGSPDGAASERAADGAGVTWGGQLSFGLQWDVTEHLVVGASMTTPTLTLFRSGSLTFNSVDTNAQGNTQIHFRDPDATFAYHLPLTVAAGVAWRARRFEAELDVRYHSQVPEYALLSSTQPVENVVVVTGSPAVRTYTEFPGLTYGASTVWNFAVGGRYTLDENWSVHGGFYTDGAAAAPTGSNVFRSVNLYGLTAGAKLKGEHLSGSLGLGFCWGSSDDFLLGEPGSPIPPVTTRLSILSVSLLYAIAYRF
jgi:long-subunit fatty acid transport protein